MHCVWLSSWWHLLDIQFQPVHVVNEKERVQRIWWEKRRGKGVAVESLEDIYLLSYFVCACVYMCVCVCGGGGGEQWHHC